MSLDKLPKEKRQWIKETAQKAVKYASSDMDGDEAVKKAIKDEDMGAGESRLVCQIFNNFRMIDQYEKGSSLEEKLSGPRAVNFRDINSDLFNPEQRKEAVDKQRNEIASDWYDKNASAELVIGHSDKQLTKTADSTAEVEDHNRSSIFSDTSSVGQDKIAEYERDERIEELMYEVESLESNIMRKRAILSELTLEFNDMVEKAAEVVSDHDFSEVESRIKTDMGEEASFVMDKVAFEDKPSSRGQAEDKMVIIDYEEPPYYQIKEATRILQGVKDGTDQLTEDANQAKEAGLEMLKLSNYSKGTMNWLERHGALELKGANSELTLGESFLSDKDAGIRSWIKGISGAKELEDLGKDRGRYTSSLGGENVHSEEKAEGDPAYSRGEGEILFTRGSQKANIGDTPVSQVGFRRMWEKETDDMSEEEKKDYADMLGVNPASLSDGLPFLDPSKPKDDDDKDDNKSDDDDDDGKDTKSKSKLDTNIGVDTQKAMKDKLKHIWNTGVTSPAQALREFGMEEVPEDYSGLGQDFVDEMKKIQIQDFVQRLKVDDTLQGYTNREIADVVNDLLETEPGIVYKPMLGVSVVKKLLEGGRYMEPQEMAELIEKAREEEE